MSQKGEILRALGDHGAPDTLELADRLKRAGIHTNRTTVAALVWDLQKQQLVTFDERSATGMKDPSRIQLTDHGREIVAQADKGVAVPAALADKQTVGDQIEALMLAYGESRLWRPIELDKELQLNTKHAATQISVTLGRDPRFVPAGTGKGIWTLKIWRNGNGHVGPSVGVDRSSLTAKTNGNVAPGGPVEVFKPTASQPVVTIKEPLPQNEKPVDFFAGFALIKAVVDRAEKRAQLVEAARMLEAAGEDELAIQTLSRVELTPLEVEVVELVRRVRG
jgi:hypothetical protein